MADGLRPVPASSPRFVPRVPARKPGSKCILTWQRNLPAQRRSRHESWCGLSPEGFTGSRKSSTSRPATFFYQLQRLVRDGCLLVRTMRVRRNFCPQGSTGTGFGWHSLAVSFRQWRHKSFVTCCFHHPIEQGYLSESKTEHLVDLPGGTIASKGENSVATLFSEQNRTIWYRAY